MPERSANLIEIRGWLNRFGDHELHDGLDLDSGGAKSWAWSAAPAPASR